MQDRRLAGSKASEGEEAPADIKPASNIKVDVTVDEIE